MDAPTQITASKCAKCGSEATILCSCLFSGGGWYKTEVKCYKECGSSIISTSFINNPHHDRVTNQLRMIYDLISDWNDEQRWAMERKKNAKKT